MKMLLWKVGALGDVVMTTPLVRQLRKHLPAATIDYLVGRSARVVLDGNPHLNRVRVFDEDILLRAQVWRLPEIVGQLRGYDAIYILDKHWVFGWLAWLARIPRRIGFRRRAFEGAPHTHAVLYGGLRHEIDCYLDLAEVAEVPVDRSDRALELPPPQPWPLARPYVVAINSGGNNPGEASEVRKLPDGLFAALVQRLAARSKVVFLGSASERSTYDALAHRHAALNLCGHTTLRQAWGVLANADAVYTTDTGLMHMAGALNARVVAVFGPTHPVRKCPPGAAWAWRDQTNYDERYELLGRVPQRSYFQAMTVADILQAENS